MNYVDDITYLNRRFLNGQLEIENKQTGRLWRGDISRFDLSGHTFTITLNWLVEAEEIGSRWTKSERELTHTFDMEEWSDDCHREGRIGITSRTSKETFLIVPRDHYSYLKRP
jgi:hypothetical protein